MEFRASLLLTLLGLLFVEPGYGQRSEMDIDVANELLKSLQDKLNDTESQQKDIEALEAKLNMTIDELTRQKAEMDRLTRENEDMQMRLNETRAEIDKLKQSSGEDAPQIAFSASLANVGEIYQGPSTDKTLIFKRIFSNAGNAYDQNTGIFTAPVDGLYYFSFSTYGYNTHVMGAMLMKNAVRQISTYEGPSGDGSDSSSNTAVLQLSVGDEVHVELWDNGRVFDNLNGHTTFSGFLLFPV